MKDYKLTKQVGEVGVYTLGSAKPAPGLDPAVKAMLGEALEAGDLAMALEAQKDNSSYKTLAFHASPVRANLVRWYDFKPGARLLEIGAGCGAVTQTLLSFGLKVDALDASLENSLINAGRNNSANLRVLVGNLDELATDERYDYIICAGAVETKNTDTFFSGVKSLLKSDGVLMLAVPNRFGIKYLAGAYDSKTGRPFDGLEDYGWGSAKGQAYGRAELENALGKHFDSLKFYYPYPGYEFPNFIHSDSYLPGESASFPLTQLPAYDPGERRLHLFNESLAMLSIEKNGLYPQLANAFLVIASDSEPKDQADFSVFRNLRKPQYQIMTKVYKDKFAVKSALQSGGEDHIKAMQANYEFFAGSKLAKQLVPARQNLEAGASCKSEFVNGGDLERRLLQAIVDGDADTAVSIIRRFKDLLDLLPAVQVNPAEEPRFVSTFGKAYGTKTACYTFAPLDLNLDNIIESEDGTLHLIDNEWLFDFPIPQEFMFGRFVYWFFLRYRSVLAAVAARRGLTKVRDFAFVPSYLREFVDPYLKPEAVDRIFRSEASFQLYVTGKKPLPLGKKTQARELDVEKLLSQVTTQTQQLEEKRQQIVALEKDVALLLHNIEDIQNSKAYHLATRLQKAKSSVKRSKS